MRRKKVNLVKERNVRITMNSQRYVRVANGIQIQYGQKVNKKGEN